MIIVKLTITKQFNGTPDTDDSAVEYQIDTIRAMLIRRGWDIADQTTEKDYESTD